MKLLQRLSHSLKAAEIRLQVDTVSLKEARLLQLRSSYVGSVVVLIAQVVRACIDGGSLKTAVALLQQSSRLSAECRGFA